MKDYSYQCLLQEQDKYCGKFKANQAFLGQIQNMNLYDYILTPNEIHKLHRDRYYQVITTIVNLTTHYTDILYI